MQATEHDITFLYSVGLCLRFGLRPKPRFSKEPQLKHWGKRHFGKLAKTGAVRKGELLRGKVSQGRPHPLSMALRSEGQTLKKKQNIAERHAQRFFFFSAER